MPPLPTTSARRYLALWFPYLPCERVLSLRPDRTGSTSPEAPDRPLASGDFTERPFALVLRSGNALRLSAVDAPARAMGLTGGMTLADAHARCPDLATAPADPEADSRFLSALAGAMRRFTPTVAVDPPDALVLDVTGCGHLFGGEKRLVRQAMASPGLTVHHALAGNAAAARALARHGKDGSTDVHALPLTALDLADEALAALRRAGLRRIGDLARRPMASLAARFGEDTVLRLRAILGEVSSPLAPSPAPRRLCFAARFAEPLLRTEDALDVIEDLLAQAARTMAERDLGGRRFEVCLHRSDGQRRRLTVETGQPVRDTPVVLRLLRERIDTLTDPIDPGFGFDAIDLAIPRTDPLLPRQIATEGEVRDGSEKLAALVDRLSVRLGEGHVLRLAPRDRHLPERAQVLEAANSDTCAGTRTGWPTGDLPRPVLLFEPPQPVTVLAGVPDGPPFRFRWNGHLHEVTRSEGPERIAAEWWRTPEGHLPGAMPPTRDYYRIEDRDGRRYWVFRHGLFGEHPDPAWYVHGLFA